MNTPPKAPHGTATTAPTQGQTNSPQRIRAASEDKTIREISSEVLVHSSYQMDVAEGRRHNTEYRHWGINE